MHAQVICSCANDGNSYRISQPHSSIAKVKTFYTNQLEIRLVIVMIPFISGHNEYRFAKQHSVFLTNVSSFLCLSSIFCISLKSLGLEGDFLGSGYYALSGPEAGVYRWPSVKRSLIYRFVSWIVIGFHYTCPSGGTTQLWRQTLKFYQRYCTYHKIYDSRWHQ